MSNMLLNNKEIKILQEFSSDYHKKVYGRDMAVKLGMNQKTVSNILAGLEKQGILKFSTEGRNKYYFLNSFYGNIKEVIKIIEIFRKSEFIEKSKSLRTLFEKIAERTHGILIIFGSYAFGKQKKNSDLDVFVVGKADLEEIEKLEEMYKIKINVVKSAKNKIDKEDLFVNEIIKNHIILKGVEDFVELIW